MYFQTSCVSGTGVRYADWFFQTGEEYVLL